MSVARRSVQVVTFICTLIVSVAAIAVIVTQTTWFKEWLRAFIVRQSQQYLNGQLSIGRLDGNLLFGVELEDVDVTMDGQTVVDIKDAGLDYNVFTFIRGYVILDDIRINQPVFHLEKTEEGWNITRLVKARTPEQPRRRRPIEVGEIGVSDGTIYFEPVGTAGVDVPSRIERIDASVGVTSDEDAVTVDIAHVSLRTIEPAFGLNALSGVIRRTADEVILEDVALRSEETSLEVDGTIANIENGGLTLDLRASSDKFTVTEMARLIPALRGYRLQPAFEIEARGPIDSLAVGLNVRDANLGNVVGDLTVDAAGPERHLAGAVSLNHFNVAAVTRNARLQSDVTGRARMDLALPRGGSPLRGTYVLEAGRAQFAGYEARDLTASGRVDGRTVRLNAAAAAYGGQVQARGTITIAGPVTYDLTGRAANVDLRNVPRTLNIPAAPSDLQFTYALEGHGRVFSVAVRFDASTLAGASIAPGAVGEFSAGAGAPTYAAKGSVTDLDAQRIGQAFRIRALTADRFRSRLTGTFDVKGSGGGRHPLTLDASGMLVDSELFGAKVPHLDFSTRFAGADAQVQAAGEFSGLDPARIGGNPRWSGTVTGSVDGMTTLYDYARGVGIDTFNASGRVDLQRSDIGGLVIDSAIIDGIYANRVGDLTQLEVSGPDLNVTGRGVIALDEMTASSFAAELHSPSLDRIGALVGRPLKGAAMVDATVTGNARELVATGTLEGSNIGYGDQEALSLDASFKLVVPELRMEAASLQATGDATFVEIGGRSIDTLMADIAYSQSMLQFDAVAVEGGREIGATGSAVLHPDHQEVHLADLALSAGETQWRTAPGSEATVRYRDERIEVADLILVSGDQRIDADGVLGALDETLRVRAMNVDAAELDRLIRGGEQRFAGRIDADVTISGPVDAPRAEGEFTLQNGAFRQFTFESLSGRVDYVGRGANVDIRLQQAPDAWLTVTGYAPLSLFGARGGPREGHVAPGAADAMDLHVESSQVDLGVIQGFTPYVTNVTGVLQANFDVSGSARDPHLDGTIDVRGGAFSIPALGTAYTGLDTRIELAPDIVTISEMQILDEHQNVMTVGGTLAVHEREVGALEVTIQSEDFEVIDNELADLKLDTDLGVTGELRAPRVAGFVEVRTGVVDVAQLLERTAADPYAVEPTEITPVEPPPVLPPLVPIPPGMALPPGRLFDALELQLGVAVPSNLILRGNDLRPARAPIDIGDINVTVGGLVQLTKARNEPVRVAGEVNTIRGSYTFQARRFEVLRGGRIRFAGTEELDPLIDVRARRIISGVETFVRVQGTLQEPELAFSSVPPLDQADILSLIVFNVPINQLGEGQQVVLVEQAAALAGGYAVSGLTRSLANVLGLDELELQPLGERGLAPSLIIGEQVGERIYFRIRQGFGAEQATEFILEYQIADFLRLQAAVAETTGGTQRITFRRVERAGLDLIFFFSY